MEDEEEYDERRCGGMYDVDVGFEVDVDELCSRDFMMDFCSEFGVETVSTC